MQRKALAQEGVYVKYTGRRDSWRPAPRGAGPGGSARGLRYADIGDPSAERHQALGILLGVRPAEELCYTGRRIAAGGTGDHVLALTKGLSGADGQGGLRSGAWGDAHGGQAHGRISQQWWAPAGARGRYSAAIISSVVS